MRLIRKQKYDEIEKVRTCEKLNGKKKTYLDI